jgi:adenylate cyclase
LTSARRHIVTGSSMGREVRFGCFRFDPDTGRLWADAREVRLTPKSAAVMSLLVAHAGEPVTKKDLFASVWPDTAVSDDALTTCIAELRRALEDDARRPRFIETRHRRGYRFAAPLSPVEEHAPPTPPSWPGMGRGHAPPREVATIAVLPFADMSPGRDHEYLCEGLAEEVINALTHVEGLRVAARTASFRFRDLGADVQSVGRQLGVSALLQGSVRKANDRLRVAVQLIEVATGYHRWSKRFDRAFDDVFAMQDEIAESVALSLGGGLPGQREPESIRRPSPDTETVQEIPRPPLSVIRRRA